MSFLQAADEPTVSFETTTIDPEDNLEITIDENYSIYDYYPQVGAPDITNESDKCLKMCYMAIINGNLVAL